MKLQTYFFVSLKSYGLTVLAVVGGSAVSIRQAGDELGTAE
jgi:hypothetical protein